MSVHDSRAPEKTHPIDQLAASRGTNILHKKTCTAHGRGHQPINRCGCHGTASMYLHGGGKPHVIIRLIWIVQIRPAPLCPWDPAAWWDSCSASHSFSAHKEAAAARGAKEQFEFTLKVILSTCRYSVESPPPKKKILFSILDSLQHRPTGARRHR